MSDNRFVLKIWYFSISNKKYTQKRVFWFFIIVLNFWDGGELIINIYIYYVLR